MKNFLSTLTLAVLTASTFAQPVINPAPAEELPTRRRPITNWEACEHLRVNAPHLFQFIVPLNEVRDTIFVYDTVRPCLTFEGATAITTGEWISTDTTNAVYLGEGFWMDTLDGRNWRMITSSPDLTDDDIEAWGWSVSGSGTTAVQFDDYDSGLNIEADAVEQPAVVRETVIERDTVFVRVNENPGQKTTFGHSWPWVLVALCLSLGFVAGYNIKKRRDGHKTDRNIR